MAQLVNNPWSLVVGDPATAAITAATGLTLNADTSVTITSAALAFNATAESNLGFTVIGSADDSEAEVGFSGSVECQCGTGDGHTGVGIESKAGSRSDSSSSWIAYHQAPRVVHKLRHQRTSAIFYCSMDAKSINPGSAGGWCYQD